MHNKIILTFFLLITCLVKSQEKPVIVVSKGHHQAINCIDLNAEGTAVVSGANDNLVKVYDMNMKQELNTFAEHTREIDIVKFSPSGKYIVSISSYQLIVHSHPEGKLLHQFDIQNVTADYNCSISRDDILYLGTRPGITVYNLNTGEMVKSLPIQPRNFVVLQDEKTIVTNATNEDDQRGIGFFSIEDGALQDFIPVEGLFLNKYDISENGDKIVFAFGPKDLGILDVKLKTINKINIGNVALSAFKLTPNGNELVTTSYDGHVVFWDLKSFEKIRDIKDLSPSGDLYSMCLGIRAISFAQKGKLIAFAYSDIDNSKQYQTVEWFEYKTMKSIGSHAGDIKVSLSIAIDHTGTVLSTGTVGGKMGIKCLDLKKGAQKAFIPGTAYLGSGGEYLAAVNNESNSYPKLEVYEMPVIELFRSFDLYGFSQVEMSPKGKFVASIDQQYIENNDPTKPAVTPFIRVWEIESGKEILHVERALLNMPRDLVFSADEQSLFVTYADKIETYDVITRKLVQTSTANVNLDFNNPLTPDSKYILSSNKTTIEGIDVQTGEKIELLKFDAFNYPFVSAFSKDYSLIGVSVMKAKEAKPYRLEVYNWETKELVCELIGHNDFVRQITFDEQNKHVYSVDDNGIVLMWDLEECTSKGTFLAFGSEDYIIQSPEGYYKSSKGNIGNIGFRQGGSLYTFDQFDLRFNRPDLVLKSLGMASEQQIEMYHKAYEKRLSRMGFELTNSSDQLHAPTLQIINKNEIPLTTNEEEVKIEIEANDTSLPLDRLNIIVNGIPIYGRLGMDLKKQNTLAVKKTISVPLSFGENQIQISAMNVDGTESLQQSINIKCDKKGEKPNLYIIAVGVRAFADSTMNLTYSDKDATDFINLFNVAVNSDKKFEHVNVQLLTNVLVTKEAVEKTREFLEGSKVDDQVILYYSGHGLLNSNYDYFLSTYDVDFSSPSSRGLAFDNFKDLVDGIAARKRLILVDACNSGEVDKSEIGSKIEENTDLKEKTFASKGAMFGSVGNSFELMKELFVELRKESGATIIASSSGKEYSLESNKWQNGAFTYALKEGLIEKKADENNDQEITVSELKKYVCSRVIELTGGKQNPTVRRENLQHNSVIY